PGASYTQTQAVTVINAPPGNYFIILKTDSTDALLESNETNNTRTVPIAVSVPDLVIDRLTVAPAAHFGRSLEVVWTVRNAGNGGARPGWSDRISLSTDALGANDISLLTLSASPFAPLAPGASYT